MKIFFGTLLIIIFFISCEEKESARVLVFSKTKANRHESIPAGKKMLLELGEKHNVTIDTTELSEVFSDTALLKYDAVVFLNTTGDVLDSLQQIAFANFIKSGKGFVGIHAASDTEHNWHWYGKLVGAYFKNHPRIQRALYKRSGQSILASTVPDRWYRTDEIYNFHSLPSDVEVLMTVDENSYEGGEHPENHPIAWYHEFEGGRSFYTAMGHTIESYSDTQFQDHILAGLRYAIGKN